MLNRFVLWVCVAHQELFVSLYSHTEVFGLSGNADTSKDIAATDDMLAALLATGEARKRDD